MTRTRGSEKKKVVTEEAAIERIARQAETTVKKGGKTAKNKGKDRVAVLGSHQKGRASERDAHPA